MHCSARSIPPPTTSRTSRRRVTPASASNSRRAGRKPPAAAGSAPVSDLDRASRLRPVPRAADPQSAAPISRGSTRSPRRPARIDNLLGDSANGLSSSLQSFTDAINEVSSDAGSIPARQVLIAEGRRAGRTSQDLRRAHARHVGRGQWPPQRRSAGNLHARAGHRQAQRRYLRRLPAERPAAQRSARSARCADQRAVGQGGRLGRRRRRFRTQRIHRQWPAAGARQRGVADHHDGGSARSGTHAAVHAHGRGHRRPVARGVRRNARRPARLAQPDARPGAQRARPHRRRDRDPGERAASRGHGPHGRDGRQLLQHRRGHRDGCHGQHRHGAGHRDAHQSRRAHSPTTTC